MIIFTASSALNFIFALAGFVIAIAAPLLLITERLHSVCEYLYSDNKILQAFGKLHMTFTNIIYALIKIDAILLILCGGKILCTIFILSGK